MAALPGEFGTGSSDEDEPPNDTKKRQGFKARKITHRTVKTRNREMSTFAMPIAYGLQVMIAIHRFLSQTDVRDLNNDVRALHGLDAYP